MRFKFGQHHGRSHTLAAADSAYPAAGRLRLGVLSSLSTVRVTGPGPPGSRPGPGPAAAPESESGAFRLGLAVGVTVAVAPLARRARTQVYSGLVTPGRPAVHGQARARDRVAAAPATRR